MANGNSKLGIAGDLAYAACQKIRKLSIYNQPVGLTWLKRSPRIVTCPMCLVEGKTTIGSGHVYTHSCSTCGTRLAVYRRGDSHIFIRGYWKSIGRTKTTLPRECASPLGPPTPLAMQVESEPSAIYVITGDAQDWICKTRPGVDIIAEQRGQGHKQQQQPKDEILYTFTTSGPDGGLLPYDPTHFEPPGTHAHGALVSQPDGEVVAQLALSTVLLDATIESTHYGGIDSASDGTSKIGGGFASKSTLQALYCFGSWDCDSSLGRLYWTPQQTSSGSVWTCLDAYNRKVAEVVILDKKTETKSLRLYGGVEKMLRPGGMKFLDEILAGYALMRVQHQRMRNYELHTGAKVFRA
ncbi:hypothetical protein MKZ38_002930 [Zalerion maritima]|uniref:Uncharacterized protein n=1 Tax=Zalerion maritima TaxID=339359 RepID=A0AAD5RNA4_9PEZI|nr:hypothetical protein MKZ38_002930 [Zalerion maritima]